MANVKIIVYTIKHLKDNKHPIVLRLTHNRIRRYYWINDSDKSFYCENSDELWDATIGRFTKNFPEYELKNYVLAEKEKLANDIIILAKVKKTPFSFQYFENEFLKSDHQVSPLFDFFDQEIARLKMSGKIGYANIFASTKSVVKKFADNSQLMFTDVNFAFLKDMESHLYARGCKPNTLCVYMRTFRTLFNMAIKRELITEKYYPFNSRLNPNGYSLGKLKQKTIKRKINKEDVIKLQNIEAMPGTYKYLTKNIFMFSFFCAGINFHDIAHLKWSNIKSGRIEYYRRKTGGLFNIAINEDIQSILNIYKTQKKPSDYVFPILNESHVTPQQQYDRICKVRKHINENLKEIAETTKIDIHITTYVARHSWANIQKKKGTKTSIIKELMGHQTEEQTEEYLSSLDPTILDQANSNLLK